MQLLYVGGLGNSWQNWCVICCWCFNRDCAECRGQQVTRSALWRCRECNSTRGMLPHYTSEVWDRLSIYPALWGAVGWPSCCGSTRKRRDVLSWWGMKSFYLDWNGFLSVATLSPPTVRYCLPACLPPVRTWGYCQCVCPEQKTDTLGFQSLILKYKNKFSRNCSACTISSITYCYPWSCETKPIDLIGHIAHIPFVCVWFFCNLRTNEYIHVV